MHCPAFTNSLKLLFFGATKPETRINITFNTILSFSSPNILFLRIFSLFVRVSSSCSPLTTVGHSRYASAANRKSGNFSFSSPWAFPTFSYDFICLLLFTIHDLLMVMIMSFRALVFHCAERHTQTIHINKMQVKRYTIQLMASATEIKKKADIGGFSHLEKCGKSYAITDSNKSRQSLLWSCATAHCVLQCNIDIWNPWLTHFQRNSNFENNTHFLCSFPVPYASNHFMMVLWCWSLSFEASRNGE